MIMQGWVCVDIVDVAERLPFLLREPKFPPMPKRAPKHDKAKAGKLSAESQVKSYQPEFTMRSAREGWHQVQYSMFNNPCSLEGTGLTWQCRTSKRIAAGLPKPSFTNTCMGRRH